MVAPGPEGQENVVFLAGRRAAAPAGPRIDLSAEPSLEIGPLRLDPPSRRIGHRDGREVILEPRAMKVLVTLAKAGGATLSRDDLIECCWETRIVADDAISSLVYRLRRDLGKLADGAFRIETVRKVGFRLVREAGAALADAGAGAVEARDRPAGPGRSEPGLAWMPRLGSGRAAVAIASAVLLILAAAVAAFFLLRPAPSPPVRVAVLPFADLTGGETFVAEGIAEEIRAAFGRNERVRVLGRASSAAIADQAADLSFVRGRLGVDYLLEGSVRSAGERIRVSVRLVSTRDGSETWSEVFDRRLGDVFALQDEIARQVELQLAGWLAPIPAQVRQRTSPEIYRDYLLARALVRERGRAGLARARTLMARAVRADPDYAPAWATLSYATGLSSETLGGSLPVDQAVSEALAAARRAVAIDPGSAEANLALGAALSYSGDQRGSVAALRRAIALDPDSATVRHVLALTCLALPDPRCAETEARRAIDLDPLWAPPRFALIVSQELRNDTAAMRRTVEEFRGRAGPRPPGRRRGVGRAPRRPVRRSARAGAAASRPVFGASVDDTAVRPGVPVRVRPRGGRAGGAAAAEPAARRLFPRPSGGRGSSRPVRRAPRVGRRRGTHHRGMGAGRG